MHFISTYTLFLAKIATVVIALLVAASGLVAIATKNKQASTGKLKVKKINQHLDSMAAQINQATQPKKVYKKNQKALKKEKKQSRDQAQRRLFVLDFIGDINASATEHLKELITATLLSATPNDEVLLRLQSPGGLVNAYGLASAQLQRLKEANIKLTISVDKMAGSGGYMMACIADTLIAAPFAILGSIGVIAQLPNFHRFLQKKNIDFEQITAGEYKRTLTMLGENTESGRAKLTEEINDTHELFKQHIAHYRPNLNIDEVATGEHWFGLKALELKLIDDIKTSDDFLMQAKDDFDMFALSLKAKKTLLQRLSSSVLSLASTLLHFHSSQKGNTIS